MVENVPFSLLGFLGGTTRQAPAKSKDPFRWFKSRLRARFIGELEQLKGRPGRSWLKMTIEPRIRQYLRELASNINERRKDYIAKSKTQKRGRKSTWSGLALAQFLGVSGYHGKKRASIEEVVGAFLESMIERLYDALAHTDWPTTFCFQDYRAINSVLPGRRDLKEPPWLPLSTTLSGASYMPSLDALSVEF